MTEQVVDALTRAAHVRRGLGHGHVRRRRRGLALALGAEHDAQGALVVDGHNQTTVKGLYAAGAAVRGLDQIVVAMGHAAVAATAIHNRCELPTEDEPDGAGGGRAP